MKKVIVIGCPGSGKSYFSRRLADKTGIPVFHLDMLFWNPDRTSVLKEEFDKRLAELLSRDSWIIDGNYGRTMETRLSACDTVFFLDLPTEICLEGVRSRRGVPRPDIPWVETEEDPEFTEYISSFGTHQRPKILALLEKYGNKKVIIFKSRDEIDAYISK